MRSEAGADPRRHPDSRGPACRPAGRGGAGASARRSRLLAWLIVAVFRRLGWAASRLGAAPTPALGTAAVSRYRLLRELAGASGVVSRRGTMPS